ncbi:fasciclin domain-containing protein [Psychrobacter sp. FME5]|uniref:fasciclin domain-containing protein n=1 Tax=Psychrobacter sp. FME5 TaxID=2487706 RepID=UPI001788368C|nr:fasciclin domain-containing protein [Psychrobacter sp. FME5]
MNVLFLFKTNYISTSCLYDVIELIQCSISHDKQKISVNAVRVNIQANNGAVYVIDTVLLPK